jgi:hypothetical protein
MSTATSESRKERRFAGVLILASQGLLAVGLWLDSFVLGSIGLLTGLWAFLASGHFTLGEIGRRRKVGTVLGIFLTMVAASVPLAMFAYPACKNVSDAAARHELRDRMMQIGVALHNYHDKNKCFPPHAIYSKDGKPLLSWRVALLPYLGHEDLYKQFKLDEPWDSPHNLALAEKMPDAYAPPRYFDERDQSNTTYFQVFVGPGAAFEGKTGLSFGDFPDGTSSTVLVAMAEEAVLWTRPADLDFNPKGPLPKLRIASGSSTFVTFGDASCRSIPFPCADADLRVVITRNGGEPFPKEWW